MIHFSLIIPIYGRWGIKQACKQVFFDVMNLACIFAQTKENIINQEMMKDPKEARTYLTALHPDKKFTPSQELKERKANSQELI